MGRSVRHLCLALNAVGLCVVLGRRFAIRWNVVVPVAECGVSVRILSFPLRLAVAAFGELLADCGCTTPIGLPVVLPGHAEVSVPFRLKGGSVQGQVTHQDIRFYTMPVVSGLFARVVSEVQAAPGSL